MKTIIACVCTSIVTIFLYHHYVVSPLVQSQKLTLYAFDYSQYVDDIKNKTMAKALSDKDIDEESLIAFMDNATNELQNKLDRLPAGTIVLDKAAIVGGHILLFDDLK